MSGYYAERLSGERLRRCYAIAPPRVCRYLDAEIEYVARRIRPTDRVLDLGCGYGRVMHRLAQRARWIVGIDTSLPSLELGRAVLRQAANCHLVRMDAARPGFGDGVFDVAFCIQNGLSAFGVDREKLVAQCVRVTKRGGRALFSTYSERFWEHRLDWFRLQSEHRLLGEIDWDATGDGVIVCKDGFRATTISPAELRSLTAHAARRVRVEEVDESSLFCEVTV